MELGSGQDIDEFLDLKQALNPRKPYWDLRRGLQEKLDLLDKKTQKAIGITTRKRLESGDLASAVNFAPSADNDE
uniref:Uncharacterized protein n=1 Tax=Ditylenchus dipsaci TaxID=166011 RepID=A0A915DK48_9BILA